MEPRPAPSAICGPAQEVAWAQLSQPVGSGRSCARLHTVWRVCARWLAGQAGPVAGPLAAAITRKLLSVGAGFLRETPFPLSHLQSRGPVSRRELKPEAVCAAVDPDIPTNWPAFEVKVAWLTPQVSGKGEQECPLDSWLPSASWKGWLAGRI